MDSHKIVPEKITKPIQLLAAWLVGLFVVNASFLLAAREITNPTWGAAMLLVAAVANVPIFIVALFLLQTKFRVQMQEDSYYSAYLDKERESQGAGKAERNLDEENARTAQRIVDVIGSSAKGKEQPITDILHQSQVEVLAERHGGDRALAQLYVTPDTWEMVAAKYSKSTKFRNEIDALIEDGLAFQSGESLGSVRLTDLGRTVAAHAEEKRKLYSQIYPSRWKANQAAFAE